MPSLRTIPKLADVVIPKPPLAKVVTNSIEERELTQTEAAWLVQDAPSQVCLVVNGHLEGFSAERLVRYIVGLGHDVEIVLRKTPGRRPGKLKVVTK